jgi:hypothetical protein
LKDSLHLEWLEEAKRKAEEEEDKTSTWTQWWLTDSTPTRRANSHAHESLTHTLPDDDLHETPGTAPRHHLFHQWSSSSTALPMTTSCRPLHVAPSTTITRRITHDGVLAVSTWSLRRPTVAHLEGLVESPPRASVASNLWPRSDTNC